MGNKKKKNLNLRAFTLIELLAVITITGILLIVGIPAISRLIFNSRKDVATKNTRTYVREANKEIKYQMSDGSVIQNGEYKIMDNGNICLEKGIADPNDCTSNNVLVVELENQPISGGTVDIYNNKVVDIYNAEINNGYVNNELNGDSYDYTSEKKDRIIYASTFEEFSKSFMHEDFFTNDADKEKYKDVKKVVLANDIVISETIQLGSHGTGPNFEYKSVSRKLDLNGHKITIANASVSPVFNIQATSYLYIYDTSVSGTGTIDLGNFYSSSIFYPFGDLTIDGGNFIKNRIFAPAVGQSPLFTGIGYSVYPNRVRGKLVINDGYFDGGVSMDTSSYSNCKNVSVYCLNLSDDQDVKVYGGTFVGQNPAYGDECRAKTSPFNQPTCQGTFLAGQKVSDTKIPDTYSISEGVLVDGSKTYTVNYKLLKPSE